MKLTVSVIIVNFNTGKLLGECVGPIKKSPNVEVVVVDNASTDDSAEKLKTHKQSLPLCGNSKRKTTAENLKLISNQENVGFARAVNQGIKVAHGEYILLLNPDTKVKPGVIDKMLVFAKSTPDAGVIGAQLLNPDDSVQASVFNFPTVWGAIKEFWLGQKGTYLKYTPNGDQPVEVDSVVGAAFLITPQARREVGLLDERFWMYFEDLDYCRRVKQAGLKVYYLPQAQIVHYHGMSGKNHDMQQKRLTEASQIYHGVVGYYVISFIILTNLFILWLSQKWQKFFKTQN